MMPRMGPLPDRVRADFYEACLTDRHGGGLRSLAHYQALFPGHETRIAEEYAALMSSGPAPAPDLSPSPSPGDKIGDYELHGEIGRGGFGVVYRAFDRRLKRHVALKTLKGLGMLQGLSRFQREAMLLARINDDGVCRVYDAGASDGTAYIAMELIEGRPLSEWLAQAREEVLAHRSGHHLRIVKILERLSRALSVAHGAGIVHRDLKPANVMVRDGDQPVLLDLGIASVSDEAAEALTLTGEVFGTAAYMSPEQVRGEKVDARADVWAFGVLAFEALIGRRPFEAHSRDALFHKILHEPAPDLHRLDRRINLDLSTIVATCLDRDPARRYESAAPLLADLTDHVAHRPIRARPAGPFLRATRWVQRHPALTATASIVAVATAIICAVWLSRERVARNFEQVADLARARSLLIEADILTAGRPEMIARGESWIETAKTLVSRLEAYENELRGREPAPLTPELQLISDQLREIAYPELALDVATWKLGIQELERRLALPEEAENADEHRNKISVFTGELEALEIRPELRETFFPVNTNDDEAWADHQLAMLALKLRQVAILLPAIEASHRSAVEIHGPLSKSEGESWIAARRLLAEDPRFSNVILDPVRGLVPLGRNRESRLLEFWARTTGPRPEWQSDFAEGSSVASAGDGMVFVLLPGGRFFTRSAQGQPHAKGRAFELSPFFMAKHETTRAQYIHLTRAPDPSAQRVGIMLPHGVRVTSRFPLTRVHHHGARMLAQAVGVPGCDLPTIHQYMWAMSEGGKSVDWLWEHHRSLEGRENLRCQGDDPTVTAREGAQKDGFAWDAPVDGLVGNAWGLFELFGNVSEWARDGNFCHSNFRDSDGEGRELNLTTRFAMGGHFDLPPGILDRGHGLIGGLSPTDRRSTTGFRVAIPLVPPK